MLTIGHAKRGAAGSVLGFDDLITTELDTLDELSPLGAPLLHFSANFGLGEQWNDSHARVSANNGDDGVGWVGRLDTREEA